MKLAPRSPWLFATLVAVVALGPAVWGLYAQTFAILGRDQGIFQYVAWALRHGDRVYRDLHEINGPLPHAYYTLMQALGGDDEHVFRTLDTLLLVVGWTAGAATLPRWIGLPPERARGWAPWCAAGLAVLGSQYARYDWWHTAQREALYAMLVFASLALQAIGHTTRDARSALRAFAAAGVASALPWFGKPPCAIFTLLQILVALHDRAGLVIDLRRAGKAAGAGALCAGLTMLAFGLAYEDLGRGAELLAKVPRLHHTIWNETLVGAYRAYRNGPTLDWALVSFCAYALTFAFLKLPRRALLAAVLPIGGFLVFAGQGKAFPYHLHMLTLGAGVTQLVTIGAIALHAQSVRESLRERVAILGALLAIGLGIKCAQDAWLSPGVQGDWPRAGATAEARATRAYVDHFAWGDYFANDLRDAAGYLAFKTRPDETVQIYGFDPYLLFLAQRRSASPVIYGFELNVDAALRGGAGARPSPELREWLLAYREQAETLVLGSVERSSPAAFALIDRAPFTHPPDAERDFEEHCPRLFAWMSERYTRAASFGAVRVWLRRDVMAR